MPVVKFALLAAAVSLWPVAAQALGVSVTPPQIALELAAGGPVAVELTVANASAEPGLFTVSADEFGMGNHSGLPAQIEISPADFRLEGLEQQAVQVTVRGSTPGVYSTSLSVVGRAMGQGAVQAGSGIKIPVRFAIAERPQGIAGTTGMESFWGILALLAFAGAGGVGWVVWRGRIKN